MTFPGRLKKEVESIDTKECKRKGIRKTGMLLTDAELEGISGGLTRNVATGADVDGIVRGGPGMEYGEIGSVANHSEVRTTGNIRYNEIDGKNWYEIDYPIFGWMAGDLLGFS